MKNFPKNPASLVNPAKKADAKNGGFTLIELMVSVGVFAIVITISMSAILAIVSANRKAQNLKSVMNNLNYVLDSVSRDIRFGSGYEITSSCQTSTNSSGSEFSFQSANGDQITYRFIPDSAGSATGYIAKSVNNDTCVSDKFIRLTSPQIKIQKLQFFLRHGGESLRSVLVVVRGYAGEKSTDKSEFDLESLISQRF